MIHYSRSGESRSVSINLAGCSVSYSIASQETRQHTTVLVQGSNGGIVKALYGGAGLNLIQHHDAPFVDSGCAIILGLWWKWQLKLLFFNADGLAFGCSEYLSTWANKCATQVSYYILFHAISALGIFSYMDVYMMGQSPSNSWTWVLIEWMLSATFRLGCQLNWWRSARGSAPGTIEGGILKSINVAITTQSTYASQDSHKNSCESQAVCCAAFEPQWVIL